jgi:hypothetical protein
MRAAFWLAPLSALTLSACFRADANDFIISCEDDGKCPEDFLCANDFICGNKDLLLPTVDPVVEQTPFGNVLITGKSLGGAEIRVFIDGDEVASTVVDPDPDPFQALGDFSIFVPLDNGNNEISIEAELDNEVAGIDQDILGNPLETDFDANTNLFSNVAAQRGVALIVPFLGNNSDQNNQGATFQDLDNDGFVDLVIGSDPQGVVRLNNGEGDFDAGPALVSHIAAAFADVDQDGDLDAALSATPNPNISNADSGAILFNNGDARFQSPQFNDAATNSEGVTFFESNDADFVDVLFQDGGENRVHQNTNGNLALLDDRNVVQSSKDAGNSAGNGSFVASCDVDIDGNPDLLINDVSDFQLFQGLGNSLFNRINGNFLINDGQNRQRGFFFADINRDGVFEIVVARGGNGINLVSVEKQAGVLTPVNLTNIPISSDGISAIDFDLDGDTDIVVSDDNGPDHLLVNQGGVQGGDIGEFIELVGALDVSAGDGEGTAVADIDGDGDQEIFVVDQVVTSRLYDNRFDDIHSRRLRVVRTGEDDTDVDIIGAVVTLFENAEDDPRLFSVQQVDGGSGHGSQEPLNLFFGGAAPRRVYKAEIQIPGCDDVIEVDLKPEDTVFRFEECP